MDILERFGKRKRGGGGVANWNPFSLLVICFYWSYLHGFWTFSIEDFNWKCNSNDNHWFVKSVTLANQHLLLCSGQYSMDNTALYFGYQTSREKFSVLWKQENVSVRYNLGKRKLYFCFSYLSEEYKLEISYENIWQIEQYRPHGQAKKFLLIQVSWLKH